LSEAVEQSSSALAGVLAAAAGVAALAVINKLVPKPEPKPWGSAFWLDPELWDRVPDKLDKRGRYGNCWDYLETKRVPEQNLGFAKRPPAPPAPTIGDIKVDHAANQTLLLTPNGWVPFAYAGIYDGINGARQTYHDQRIHKLWLKVQEHGWVRSGDWDHGYRCEGCWDRHTPGYHPHGYHRNHPQPDGPWIQKPSFAPWLGWRWNESLRDPDPRKVKFC
jgi:hypothetical protein